MLGVSYCPLQLSARPRRGHVLVSVVVVKLVSVPVRLVAVKSVHVSVDAESVKTVTVKSKQELLDKIFEYVHRASTARSSEIAEFYIKKASLTTGRLKKRLISESEYRRKKFTV
jgi:copper chaperone CopZ